jgi:ubiquinone/menaquinone biosynthesis C-methylase UbiE
MENTSKEKEIELHKFLSREYVDKRYATGYSMLYHDYWNEEIISFLPSKKDTKILDCGCGTGILLKDLDKLYKSSCGLDISYEMLSDAQNGVCESDLIVGDIETLPFSEGSLDVIVCRGSLHHVPLPQKALNEIHKSLKKGGSLVISEPCIDSIIIRFIRKILYKKSNKFGENHKAFASIDLEEMLNTSGFTIEKTKPLGYFAYPLCGFPDFIPLLNYVPFSKYITKFLISFDKFLSRIPIIKKYGWQAIILARK